MNAVIRTFSHPPGSQVHLHLHLHCHLLHMQMADKVMVADKVKIADLNNSGQGR